MTAMNQAVGMNVANLTANTATALFYGLHSFTYEGGPGLAYIGFTGGATPQTAQILKQVNLDPGMTAQVTQGLTDAFQSGVDMYMYYIGVQNSLWGATPDVLDLDAPKFAALIGLAGKSITCTAGTSLPGSIPAVPAVAGILADGSLRQTAQATGWYFPKATTTNPAHAAFNGSPVTTGLAYLVNVSEAGSYSVSLVLDDTQTSFQHTATIKVDQKSIGTIAIPLTRPSGTPTTVGSLPVTLTPGLHLVEIVNANATKSSGFAFDSINFTSQ